MQMLNLHPAPFAHSIRSLHEPMLDLQTNRNLEHYKDPFDPTLGVRNEVFSESMQVGVNGPSKPDFNLLVSYSEASMHSCRLFRTSHSGKCRRSSLFSIR